MVITPSIKPIKEGRSLSITLLSTPSLFPTCGLDFNWPNWRFHLDVKRYMTAEEFLKKQEEEASENSDAKVPQKQQIIVDMRGPQASITIVYGLGVYCTAVDSASDIEALGC